MDTRCGVQTFHSSGRSWELRVTAPRVRFMARLCLRLSYLFQYVFFLVFTMHRSYSTSEFLSEGIVWYVAVALVCVWEEVSSRASGISILVWNLMNLLFIIMNYPSLSLVILFVLKLYFADIYVPTPAFFRHLFPWYIFSIFSFNLCLYI